MSDPVLTEFWQQAPPPWNTLGPEIAAVAIRGIIPTQLQPTPIAMPMDRLHRWSEQMRDARKRTGLTQKEIARRSGLLIDRVWDMEHNCATKGQAGWAKLATFYGIKLE